MADFYQLISGAVAKLPENSAAARRALYERIRGMLVAQLRGANPAISDSEIEREACALEDAIDRVEADAGKPARASGPAVTAKVAPPARASAPRRMRIAVAAAIVACALAGGYFVYARLLSPTGASSIAAVPAGEDTIAIKGFLADFAAAASKPSSVLLLHVRCGATLVERDFEANPINPSGPVDAKGRFSIAAKKAFLGQIIKVGVRATTAPADELNQDFLVLGFFADDKLELLTGADGKTVKISPQGRILNAGALKISSTIAPPLIVTRKSDGNIYATGGGYVLDEAC